MKPFKLPSFSVPSSVPLILRKALAEFIGTYILVVIGNGSIAQSKLTDHQKGNFFTINWGWALGLILGILASANISGGHLNPAVSLAFAITRRFSWKDLPLYWLAQYLGALAASGTVLGIYHEAIQLKTQGESLRIVDRNPTDPGMASIFANYPAPYFSTGIGLIEEILATTIFVLVICVTTDRKFSKIPVFLQPFYIGFSLLGIGVSFGANCGYGLNPARDLAPRLVSYFGGWGEGVFSFRGYNAFWIYIVGPHIGALLGVCLFHLLLKSQQAIQNNELDLIKANHARQVERYHQQPIELFDISTASKGLRDPTVVELHDKPPPSY